jgi:FkbM family methyltransferase
MNNFNINSSSDLIRLFNLKSVLDIGANVGNYSSDLKKIYPNLYFFMIEANINCQEELAKTNIDYIIKCLSNSKKQVKLYQDKMNLKSTGVSYKLELHTNLFSEDIFSLVDADCLDSVLFNHFNYQRYFDFVKIDTQGTEKEIIEGGLLTIQNAKFIELEVSLIEWNKGSPLKNEIVDFMESINYDIYLQLDTLYAYGNPVQENIIFKNKNN